MESPARRLEAAAAQARAAEARGDEAAVNEAWRRYRLISDAAREPEELLAEGIALSVFALELAGAAAREE
ncbi:MAG TPA: hypothetical protein VGV40_01015 [Solirubrobacteraceae bacterium]|nr:hypothetical protein [Solirubrobacteraceae bacterium]